MELQWPLIIFSTFVAWSSGLFVTQGIYALKGQGIKAQMKALITAVVILAIGGIAVTFHLQHFERIFNGFGHLTSGITQELIGMVVMVIFMIIFFSYLRRGGLEAQIPKWLAICTIVIGVVMVCVCAHSYNMASRPAWDSILQILSLLGASCILGPGTFAFLLAISQKEGEAETEGETALTGLVNFYGSIAGAVLQVVYLIAMCFIQTTTYASTYFDPTSPTKDITTAASTNPFAGDALVWSILVIVACIGAVVCAFMGKKKGNWKICGIVIAACGVIAAIALRVVFYMMGISVYPFY